MTNQAPGNLKATVAGNIRAARDVAGLRQRDLAERLDVDPMLVSKWERGVHTPGAKHFAALALALGQPIAWFYTDHEEAAA